MASGIGDASDGYMDKAALIMGFCLVGCAQPAVVPPPTLTSAVFGTKDGPITSDRALPLYSRVRAFEMDGQCDEAKAAYEQYAKAVRGIRFHER